MCIIIIKQKRNKISQQVLKNSARKNPHGLGIVWLDTFKVSYHGSKDYKKLNTTRPFIAHFRYATIGKICKENTHPFKCGKKHNELLMMNGTISELGNKNMTDTQDLAIKLGKIERHVWKQKLAQYSLVRFVSINTRNRTFQIYNKHLWTHKDKVWYSKDNVFTTYKTPSYISRWAGNVGIGTTAPSEFVFENHNEFEDEFDWKNESNVCVQCANDLMYDESELSENKYYCVSCDKSFSKEQVMDFTQFDTPKYEGNKELVAVYGTLKRGFGNHRNFLQDQEFVGSGTTQDRYPLIVKGLPFLLNEKGKGHNVEVDVFNVDMPTLESLDALENHPTWYRRKEINILLNGSAKKCWIYFNITEQSKGEKYHKTFKY